MFHKIVAQADAAWYLALAIDGDYGTSDKTVAEAFEHTKSLYELALPLAPDTHFAGMCREALVECVAVLCGLQ